MRKSCAIDLRVAGLSPAWQLLIYFHNVFPVLTKTLSQVQHGMGPLINMQNSVFLPLWDNHELYGRKVLHIESFSAIKSENLVRISKFFV